MKTLTKTTHIARIRQADQSQVQQVCRLLAWDEQQYCQYQFYQYTGFLTRMFHEWPDIMLQQVMYSPTMRGFWNNEWAQRTDDEFLPFAKVLTEDAIEVEPGGNMITVPGMELGDAYLMDEYLLIHNIMALVDDDLFMMKYNNVLSLISRQEVETC